MKKDISDRADIKLLIDTFYSEVQKDDLLNYIFTDVAHVNWVNHLPVMYNFWENVLFHTGTYEGNPLLTHLHLNKVTPLSNLHFERWIKIFMTVTDELFEGENAASIKNRARSIATVMQIKIQQNK